MPSSGIRIRANHERAGGAGWLLLLSLVLVTAPARGGAVFISGEDSDACNHCSESRCGRMVGHVLAQLYDTCSAPVPGDCILAVGTNGEQARTALLGGFSFDCGSRLGWNDPANGG